MICGILGKALSGKDTFGTMLAEELRKVTGDTYILMAFAKSLKDRCQRDFDLSWEQLWGDKKEIIDHRYSKPGQNAAFWTSREILQAYGQFFRTIDGEFWVKELFRTIEDKEYNNIIITDVRHINEADAIKENGGINLKIIRDVAGSKVAGADQHISETALDNYEDIDFTIINNGTLEELRKTAGETAVLISTTHKLNGGIING